MSHRNDDRRVPRFGAEPDWFDRVMADLDAPDPEPEQDIAAMTTDTDAAAAGAHAEWVAEVDAPPPANMPANPKQFYGDQKVPVHLFPSTAIALGCMAFLEGKLKYGSDNFRAVPVEAMTYVRAGMGHLIAYGEGRDVDPASGIDELGKALACIAILIDATAAGTLIDNRKFPGGYFAMTERLEAQVKALQELHADKKPRHFTIADAPQPPVAVSEPCYFPTVGQDKVA